MSDVVLIHPGAQNVIYGDLRHEFTAIEPPPWTRMIAGWLRDRDYDVAIIDQEAEGLSPSDVAQRLKPSPPRLIVIVVVGHQPSASTQQMTGARKLVRSVRAIAPILMVGNHPSALPYRTLKEEGVQYVCDGEGPWTIAGLLDGAPKTTIPGLVWRKSDMQIARNATANLIDIDDLHGDVWDMLPMDRYRAHTWQCMGGWPRQPYASIYTTLGCPYKCSFCMINTIFHANRYRRRHPLAVARQIQHLYHAYGVKTFKFADEMFVLNPNHYLPICEELARSGIADEINIWAYARVDTVKPDTLKTLRKAGIRWLCLGIESGSAHVRDGAEKTLGDEDIRDSVRAIQEAGIYVLGNFIFGLPDDTMESMRATLDLAKSIDCEFANFYSAMGYPGSKLFDDVNPEDLPEHWSGYSQHSYDTTPLPTETLSSRDVLWFRDMAFLEYFTDERYLELTERRFGIEAREEIEHMTAQPLPRKLLEAA